MRSYIYQAPFGKGSTQICEIKNSNEEIVGSIQRYYNSKLYSLLDFLIGKSNLFVRVKAKDANGNMIINAIRKNYQWAKPDFYVNFIGGDWEGVTFHARQLNNILINPEFTIKNDDIQITSKTAMLDWVRFYEGGQEIARWRSFAKKKYKTYIEIEKGASVQEPLFYVVLGHMLYFIGQ